MTHQPRQPQPPVVTTLEGYLAPSRAAHRIGIASVTLRTWVKKGWLPALRTPNGIVIKVEDVERAAAGRAQHARA